MAMGLSQTLGLQCQFAKTNSWPGSAASKHGNPGKELCLLIEVGCRISMNLRQLVLILFCDVVEYILILLLITMLILDDVVIL